MSTLVIRPGYVVIKDGLFDSRYKHLRQVTSGIDFWMTQGPSMAVFIIRGSNSLTITWRYEVGPRSVTPFSPFNQPAYTPAAGFAVDRGGAL